MSFRSSASVNDATSQLFSKPPSSPNYSRDEKDKFGTAADEGISRGGKDRTRRIIFTAG
jgi:hypothetical protein